MFDRLLNRFEQRRAGRKTARSAASAASSPRVPKSKSPSAASSKAPASLPSTAPTTPHRRSRATSSEPVRPKMPWDGKLTNDVQPSSTTKEEGAARARQFRRCLFRDKRNKDWRSYAVFVDDDGEDDDVKDLCWRGKSWNAPVRNAKGPKKEEKKEKEKGGLRRWSQIRFGHFGKH